MSANCGAKYVRLDESCYVNELTYPGTMSATPFLMAGSKCWSAEVGWADPNPQADPLPLSLLQFHGECSADANDLMAQLAMEPRYPVLAFGANRNRANLLWKFTSAQISGSVLGLPGIVRGAEVVAANLFYSGHFYADLACWLADQAAWVEALVLLLSRNQLTALHRSEEVPLEDDLRAGSFTYGALPALFEVELRAPFVGRAVQAIGYVSWSSAWSPFGDNRAVAFRDIAARGRKVRAFAQRELFDMMCERHFPGQRPASVLARFRRLWQSVRAGDSGYSNDWYADIVRRIREEGVRDEQGEIRTGFGTARDRGTLLPTCEIWSLPSHLVQPLRL
jgi:hypothetical protein